ncbi:F-box/kelch-repeat protein [Spatholobus suberectus]|nr:F-box/kelch-repeat protein [Spatholobus suberectus]
MEKKRHTVSDSLPLELVREILLRLPVRSVLRFKCVCKSWLSVVSDQLIFTLNPSTWRHRSTSILLFQCISFSPLHPPLAVATIVSIIIVVTNMRLWVHAEGLYFYSTGVILFCGIHP